MNLKGIFAVLAACAVVAVGVWGVTVWRRPPGPAIASLGTAPLYQQQDPPMSIQVYYATEDGALEPEPRTIFQSSERLNQMKQAVMEALKPPQIPGHVAVVPEGTTLRELYLDAQRTVFLDCSSELASKHGGGSWNEWLTVQALVATVMKNFEDVKNLQLLIEGHAVDSLRGHVELARPLGLDASIIRPPLAQTLP